MAKFFKLACPKCGKSLKVPQDLAGKSRACPYCRATVRIPDAVTPPPPVMEPESFEIDTSIGGVDVKKSAKPGKARSTPKKKKPSWYSAGSGDSASSDVSLVLSGLIGAVMAMIWLMIVYPLRSYQFGQLFWDRGWVPFATTFLMFWSIAILMMKWLNLKQQKESMLLDVLPTEVSEEITIESLDGFVDHINELPGITAESFLINRVLRGIEHFRVRKSAAETVTMMESQSAIDANNVAGSYAILKVFIWALPIFGFIGTVIGVSAAVASLASSLDNASDMTAMKGALNSVFGGLGTAFDTTLLALIMSMFVKIPTSAMQKSEEDLITSVDEYCNENLLRRLNDGREGGAERGAGGGSGDAKVFREAVEAAMGTHHAELENWLSRLDAIGGQLTEQVSEGWDKINAKMQKQQLQHARTLQEQQRDQQAQLQAQLDQMANEAGKIRESLGVVAENAAAMSDMNGSFGEAQETLQQQFAGIAQGLSSLSGILEKLGDQTVVVQQVAAKPEKKKKRGWF